MNFSENAGLGDRFIRGLRANGGTLCISALSVAEACRLDDPRHAHHIDRFLRALGQQIYCADMLATFKSESSYSGLLTTPPADQDLAREMLAPRNFAFRAPLGAHGCIDRKSTRLNSSH